MYGEEKFNLGKFLTGNLGLEANTCPHTRSLPDKKHSGPQKLIFSDNPLDILGERTFSKSEEQSGKGTDIQEFYRDAQILITGGTGFLGKLLTEKLVRSIPHLGHIYLLIRTKRGKDPQERLEKLLEDKMFRRMREEVPWYHSKVTAVAGDLHEPGLGLSAEDRQLLTDQVQVLFHSAADVKFTQPLKVAIESNVTGTRRVMDLASEMKQLKACVHVSTAFSQCVRRVIPETIPRMNIPYKDILNSINIYEGEEGDPVIIRLMQGWPNTYTFSKALCEIMLDEEYQTLPLSIFRPSVIVPTYKEPVRGWTDNLYGPLALSVAAGLGVLHCYHIDDELSLDVVPADYVINAMITVAKATGTSRRGDDLKVFNFTTRSPQRQWCWKHVEKVGKDCTICWPFNRALWYFSYESHTSRVLFEVKHLLLHKTPAWVIDKTMYLMGKLPRLMNACQKVDALKSSLEYISFNCFEFENNNMTNLWLSMEEDDKTLFHFDTDNYDVLDSVIKSTVGVKYYFFKEDFDTLSAAKRKHQWLYWIHNSVKTAFWFAVLTVAVRIARVVPL